LTSAKKFAQHVVADVRADHRFADRIEQHEPDRAGGDFLVAREQGLPAVESESGHGGRQVGARDQRRKTLDVALGEAADAIGLTAARFVALAKV